MSQEQKLEPCPFCGSSNVGHYEVEGRDNHSIECFECFSSGNCYKTKPEATEAWNRRAALSATQPAQAAQPSLDSVVTHWRARAAEHASSRDESYQEYAAGITDALNAVLSAQQPAQAAQGAGEAVASIYITPDGSREMDDWKHDLPVGQNILYTQPAAGADVLDAKRYRMVRRGQHWSVINGIGDTLRGEALDAAIDAAIAASGRQE